MSGRNSNQRVAAIGEAIIADLGRRIAEERSDIIAMIDRDLMPLVERRAVLRYCLEDVERIMGRNPAPVEAAPATPAPRTVPEPVRAVPAKVAQPEHTGPTGKATFRSLAARDIHRMLLAGPREGIRGALINRILMERGYTLDTAEKTKTKMGYAGAVVFDRATGLWALTERGRDPGQVEFLDVASPRPRAPRDPRLEPCGRIVMEALRSPPGRSLTMSQLHLMPEARAYSYSSMKHAVYALSMHGYVTSGGRGKRLWSLTPEATAPSEA